MKRFALLALCLFGSNSWGQTPVTIPGQTVIVNVPGQSVPVPNSTAVLAIPSQALTLVIPSQTVNLPVVVPPPPSCTTPQPANDSQTLACPAGTTGTWTQTRSYSAAAYPTCWTPGAWLPVSPPAGACPPIVVTPPSGGFAADPGYSLSGTIAQGKQVTVTGPNFGSHPNYNPGSFTWQGNLYLNALVQDFSTGVFTQGLSQDETGATWTVVKTGCPANAAQCALWKGATSRQGVAEFSPKVSTGTLYADFKFKPAANCKGMKLFRTWGSADSIYMSTCAGLDVRGGDDSGNDVYGGVSDYSATAFNHVEVFADKSFTPYVNTQQQWSRAWNSGNLVGHTIDFGNLLEVGDSATFSNLYLDFTYVRCEIADAPTWAAAKHHEVQIPVSWAPKGVTLALNGGEIGLAGEYLYCFDAANNPSRVGQIATH